MCDKAQLSSRTVAEHLAPLLSTNLPPLPTSARSALTSLLISEHATVFGEASAEESVPSRSRSISWRIRGRSNSKTEKDKHVVLTGSSSKKDRRKSLGSGSRVCVIIVCFFCSIPNFLAAQPSVDVTNPQRRRNGRRRRRRTKTRRRGRRRKRRTKTRRKKRRKTGTATRKRRRKRQTHPARRLAATHLVKNREPIRRSQRAVPSRTRRLCRRAKRRWKC